MQAVVGKAEVQCALVFVLTLIVSFAAVGDGRVGAITRARIAYVGCADVPIVAVVVTLAAIRDEAIDALVILTAIRCAHLSVVTITVCLAAVWKRCRLTDDAHD